MSEEKFPQDHAWCSHRLVEAAQLLRDRKDTLWQQETMTKREVVEVQKLEQFLSRLANAGYAV